MGMWGLWWRGGSGLAVGALGGLTSSPPPGTSGGREVLKVGSRDLAPWDTWVMKFLARSLMLGEAPLEIPAWCAEVGVWGMGGGG